MSFLELKESGGHGDLSRYSPKDRRFLEKVQDRLGKGLLGNDGLSSYPPEDRKFLTEEQNKVIPLADKIRGAVPKILLAASFGALSLGTIFGSVEIFTGGVGLCVLWEQIHPSCEIAGKRIN